MSQILTQKKYRNYENLSRYSVLPTYFHTLDERYTYATAMQLNTNTPYEIYIAKGGETPDVIALEFYNTPTLYWVILDYNRIQDPYVIFEKGTHVKIPDKSQIAFLNDD